MNFLFFPFLIHVCRFFFFLSVGIWADKIYIYIYIYILCDSSHGFDPTAGILMLLMIKKGVPRSACLCGGYPCNCKSIDKSQIYWSPELGRWHYQCALFFYEFNANGFWKWKIKKKLRDFDITLLSGISKCGSGWF
jgi:hypothetical protein